MIIVQTPLRVSLFGGGTDFRPFFLEEGGCVLTSAIDKYIFVIIKKRFDQKLRVGYTLTEMVDHVSEIQHELIRESFMLTGIEHGVEITTMGDIPSAGSGLGSSSTVTVGTLNAIYTLLGQPVLAEDLARKACEIEIDILRKPIGIQDQYIAAYGGFRFMEFTPEGKVEIQKIVLDANLERRLNENLMLFYTGSTRRSSTVLKEQSENLNGRREVLREMKKIAYCARDELLAGNLDNLGHLLHESWLLKKQLASQVTNNRIDEIYQTAREAGAIGGKVTGAGGGGFILLYCPKEQQDNVRDCMDGLQELTFRLEQDGSKVIFNYRR